MGHYIGDRGGNLGPALGPPIAIGDYGIVGDGIASRERSVSTRVAQIKDGWVGQVFVGRKIAWESAAFEDIFDEDGNRERSLSAPERALQAARDHVQARVCELFAD